MPKFDGIDGSEHMTSAWDVLSGEAALADEILVYEDTELNGGPSTAEHLAAVGARVELATPCREVASRMVPSTFRSISKTWMNRASR